MTQRILDFCGVLEPQGFSPYKICELDLSSLKASKNLEFLRINLEFSKDEFRISRDCFASLAMTKILEFPKPCVIPRLDRGISSQNRDPRVKPEDDTRLMRSPIQAGG